MKNKFPKGWLGTMVACLLLATVLALVTDFISVYFGKALSVPKFALLLLGMFLLVVLIPDPSGKWKKRLAVIVTLGMTVPLLTAWLCWKGVSENGVYISVDSGKSELYSGQRVMLLVPHQDDDINVLGGVMEEYVKYGSEVYVVFSTNGDYYGLAESRMEEAVKVLGHIGIPKEHVIFLGYGDLWDPDGPHIYNAKPGEVVTSAVGATETYGTAVSGAYREGNPYTIENYLGDIESVILEYRPDVIYCVDYDYNIDHRALSHGFEKAMGKILKAEPEYRPLVYKGFAYNTAWESKNDFYTDNLLPAVNIYGEPYNQKPENYRWEDRVRLPVGAENLSRSVISAELNRTLSMYASQGANMYGPRVINSDKVFWQRLTTSLCYDASVTVSSGSAELLTDFMVLENNDLLDSSHFPGDGTWIPAKDDEQKQITVTFPQPTDLRSLYLYDHPHPEHNIMNVTITFDDGSVVETGALHPGGAATIIPAEKAKVRWFRLELEQVEGEGGLAELEAYGTDFSETASFVKLMDRSGNFVYDYWIESAGKQQFQLYTAGNAPLPAEDSYSLTCDNDRCTARWDGNEIYVECPVGESCVITVSSEDGAYADSVCIRNPSGPDRAWCRFWLSLEEKVMDQCFVRRFHERLFLCRLYTKVFGLR